MGEIRGDLGARGEGAARRHYEARGYRLVAQNWRCAFGEIDLVLERDACLVICEVKTRSGTAYGAGVEAVHRRKQDRLRRLADAFVSSRRWRGRGMRSQ